MVLLLVHAYNCTRSNVTGFSPYFPMYGRQPMLPIDTELSVQTPDITSSSTHRYIQKLCSRLEWACKKARKKANLMKEIMN